MSMITASFLITVPSNIDIYYVTKQQTTANYNVTELYRNQYGATPYTPYIGDDGLLHCLYKMGSGGNVFPFYGLYCLSTSFVYNIVYVNSSYSGTTSTIPIQFVDQSSQYWMKVYGNTNTDPRVNLCISSSSSKQNIPYFSRTHYTEFANTDSAFVEYYYHDIDTTAPFPSTNHLTLSKLKFYASNQIYSSTASKYCILKNLSMRLDFIR